MTTETSDTPTAWCNGDIKHQLEYGRSPKLESVKQGTRVVEEPIDNEKYESTFLPEILEAAKKKCCAWCGVSNMSFWRSEQTSLGIMGWASSEERIASLETEVECSESAEWESES